ncbi:MAG: hypothetical protein A2629_00280 [Candidatus Levybacteria bacterium RIFCSPHIGHO2_01_FULL_41_15]|nr:MAG: hypothetical protein A2629_00280 [Candidatus Levybacteria bacterium RIFCSPHIGHO2_01_FULL_41_15]
MKGGENKMLHLINGKVLLSGATILAAAALVIGATFAFFSDSEISEDNTFIAGSVDLKVDDTASYLGQPVSGSTWNETDLTNEKFFNFNDIKPGDYGENTISLHVVDNDAWVCATINNMEDEENTFLQTELDTQNDDGVASGELAENLNFFAWADDGDNVWESGEFPLFSNTIGPASDVLDGVIYSLADSTTDGGPFIESQTKFIGLAWCAGTLTNPGNELGNMTGNTGLNCDGSSLGNEAQTDSVTADITFTAVQHRNNPDFSCQSLD